MLPHRKLSLDIATPVADSGHVWCGPEAPGKPVKGRCATTCASTRNSRNGSFSNVILLALLLAILAFLALGMDAEANQAPSATIDSITPELIDYGSTVAFAGHGNDTDGNVTGYFWRSSIDGNLSTSASFSATNMSVGNH
ncbi:MAG: hypothetical protein QGH81_04080, partial [Candidatus Poseidoniia archaeon]|nr:hypothetical protein [Candidatus Poseidoniia archaeon]